MEKGMPDVNNYDMPHPPLADADMAVTPANSGGQVKSMNSEAGPGFGPLESYINSRRLYKKGGSSLEPVVEEFAINQTDPMSSKKRLFSSTRKNGSGIESVVEELSLDQTDPDFKLAQVSENELSPETNDLIVETEPTQTKKVPLPDQPMEQLADSIRKQLKTYFDTPGSAQIESLIQLALGLNRSKAASLFY